MLCGVTKNKKDNLCPLRNLHRDIYINLIHNCPNWKQPVYSFVGKRIHKLWYFQTAQYYSVLKKYIWIHKKTWNKFRIVLISELSQSESLYMLYDSSYMASCTVICLVNVCVCIYIFVCLSHKIKSANYYKKTLKECLTCRRLKVSYLPRKNSI